MSIDRSEGGRVMPIIKREDGSAVKVAGVCMECDRLRARVRDLEAQVAEIERRERLDIEIDAARCRDCGWIGRLEETGPAGTCPECEGVTDCVGAHETINELRDELRALTLANIDARKEG